MSRWPSVALGDIFEIARGGSPRPIQDYITDDPDGVNWIMISDASDSSKYITRTKKRISKGGVKKSRMVHSGDFLLTNSMSFGRPYIMRTSGCIHDGWLVLSGKKDIIDQDFFYHLLGSDTVYSEFTRLAAGATVKNLNIELVKNVHILLPPLVEQKKIGAILDAADDLRRKRREALQKLDDLPQVIYAELFGDPVTNPKIWPTGRLRDVARISTGSTPPGGRDGMFGGGIPFITPGDLGSGAAVQRTVTESGAAASRRVRANATLVCCIGATIGKMDKAAKRSAFNQQINAVEWSGKVDDDFGYQTLTFFKKKIAAWGASTTLPILKKSAFEEITIPVPPLEAQRALAQPLAEIDHLKRIYGKHLEKLERLFGSLQHSAFQGELTSERGRTELEMAG